MSTSVLETKSWREYQRKLRRYRAKKKLAWMGVTLLGALIIFALGSSFVLCQGRTLVMITIALVVAWGFWSVHFLTTRH